MWRTRWGTQKGAGHARDLSALPDKIEIEIEDEDEERERRYHHRVIETNADEHRKLIYSLAGHRYRSRQTREGERGKGQVHHHG